MSLHIVSTTLYSSNNYYSFTKATGCIKQEKIRIHNYAKTQHMLKYYKYRYTFVYRYTRIHCVRCVQMYTNYTCE